MRQAELGRELVSLAACMRWNFAANVERSPPAIPPGVDWTLFLRLARRHRVQGLAWNALAPLADGLPAHVADALSSEARSIAATNLVIAAECGELQRRFERSEIPLLFVKGLTVGALAYRSPLLKMGWDIDLLIDPAALPPAAGLLADRGFRLRIPSRVLELASWHAGRKESVWSRDDGLHVELHTRLADNRRLIPTIDVHSPHRPVDVSPSLSLPTLGEEELFAYLAVHGASSAWFRLKWIADFAGLVHGKSARDIEVLYQRSQELGAARAAGQALLVADTLFDTLLPAPSLKRQLVADRSTRLLCTAALRMLTGSVAEPTERTLGTFAIHWTQFLLRPGLYYKVSELGRQAAALVNRAPH